ncbi:MAG: IS1595 family transposase, partial [Rhodomicrobium sp.]
MARNPVQFQKGMSLAAFQAEYGGKESCEAALRAQRWPRG